MKVTKYTRAALAYRRQQRALTSAGYKRVFDPLHLNQRLGPRQRIVAVEIGPDGHDLYVKLAEPEKATA